MSMSFPGVRSTEANETTLTYREQGTGEPVVFVHGGISDLRTWNRQLPAIGESYRAIAYSRRFARPNAPMDPDTRDDVSLVAVEDLAAFLRKVQAAPAHLVGNSLGAYICLVTAIRYPELVRTLVLAEPPALPLLVSVPPRLSEMLGLLLTRPRAATGIVQFFTTLAAMQRKFSKGEDARAARIFTRGVAGRDALEGLSEDRWEQIIENLDELKAFGQGVLGFPPIDADGVCGVRAPVLLMTGEHSALFLRALTDRLEELLPNVQRLEIRDASHLMHEDNATAVNGAIVQHVRESERTGRCPASSTE